MPGPGIGSQFVTSADLTRCASIRRYDRHSSSLSERSDGSEWSLCDSAVKVMGMGGVLVCGWPGQGASAWLGERQVNDLLWRLGAACGVFVVEGLGAHRGAQALAVEVGQPGFQRFEGVAQIG